MIRVVAAFVTVISLFTVELAHHEDQAVEAHTHADRIRSLADAYRASRGVTRG